MHSLLLLAFAGFPLHHSTLIPGTKVSIADAEKLGLVFSADLPKHICYSWGIDSDDYRLIYFPLAFADILLSNKPNSFKEGHPLHDALSFSISDLQSSVRIFRSSYQSFEEIICQHLSYRAAVAQVLARQQSATSIPLYQLIGTELPADLMRAQCPSNGLPVKYSGSVTSEFSGPTVSKPLRMRSTVEISLSDVPAVVHTAGQKNPVDGVLSVHRIADGALSSSTMRFWISVKFSSGGKNAKAPKFTESESESVTSSLVKYIEDISSDKQFCSSDNYGIIVTNRSVPEELRKRMLRSKILAVGIEGLDTFLSPTLSQVLFGYKPKAKGKQ